MTVKKIENQDELLAIIIKSDYNTPGITFFTPEHLPQQLAFMSHRAGKKIVPHIHNAVHRDIFDTAEVLIIKKGKMQIDFYSYDEIFIQSEMLGVGDIVLLYKGGHGFTIIEDVEMFEVKQGPYLGELDKRRFAPIKEGAFE